MYHCKLHLVIACQDRALREAVFAAEPLERFEHEVHTVDELSGSETDHCDVVFSDWPSWRPGEMRGRYGERCRLILCAGGAELAQADDQTLEEVDEIWETPLYGRVAALRFRRLQESIRRDKECRLAQTYLDSVIDTIPDMIWFKSRDGLHLKVNQAFCQTVGKTREDVTGKDHCYIWDVSREEFERGEFVCKDTDDYVLRTGKTCQSDEKVKSQHGMRQFKTYKSPLADEDGSIMGTVGVGHDVTDLENMDTEMEIILRSMPYAILVRNEEGVIIDVNPKFEKYFDLCRGEILGLRYEDWSATAFENGTSVNSEGYVEAQTRATALTVEIHEEMIYDVFQNVVGGLSIYRDVTLERALEKQIVHNSNTDFMTGLYNRRCFYQYVRKNRADRCVSLMYLDLDYFKKVNDLYGHGAGDRALVETANLLREEFEGEFIARFGGDEFLVALLGPCDLGDLQVRAEQLLERMKEVFSKSRQLYPLTASIGIAQTTDPSVNIDTLIQQSDAALYDAKQQGRSRCCVYTPPDAREG